MPQRPVCRQNQQRCGPDRVAPAVPRLRAERGSANWSRGLRAEQRAAAALRAEGWEILAERARTACGEIDLVVRQGGLLVFVEVKSRPTLADAAFCLGEKQRKRLREAAEILLAQHPDWLRDGIRFDLVLVDGAGAVRRIRDAFRQENDGLVS